MADKNQRNIFLDALDSDLRKDLIDRFGEGNVPQLFEGWDDDVLTKLEQVQREPIILDEYAYDKVFPSRSRRTAGSVKLEAQRALAAARQDITVSGLDHTTTAMFRHYARGLCLMYDLGVKLGLPKDVIRTGPKAMLGYKFVNHQGALEFGISLTTDQAFPETVVEAAKKLMRRRYDDAIRSGWDPRADRLALDDYMNVVASYPRGKNTGLPWMASGSDRFTNDLVLAIDAALAGCLVRGIPVDDMFRGLLLGYVVFSRFQRTGKRVPLQLSGSRLTSVGIEARRRIINSTPKIISLACKPLVKFTTVFHLLTPEFAQDRDDLRSRIRSAGTVVATDASRFDLRSGGPKLRQGLDVLVDTATYAFPDMPRTVVDLVYKEAFLPTMITQDSPDGSRSFARWSSASALRSGASTTSRVGSLINLMYDMSTYYFGSEETMSVDDLVNLYITKQPTVIQGDDMLKLFRDDAEADSYMGALPQLERVGMSVEQEHPTKFLGYLTRPLGMPDDPHKAEGLYHGANPLDNMFFPERFRTYAVASMISRYVILKVGEAKKVVDILTSVSRDPAVAMSWYRKFYSEMYAALKIHYDSHPVGAARAYFATLPDPADVTELKLAQMIKHDEDELLRHIAQTARFEVNTALFGEERDTFLSADDTDSSMLDEQMVTASLEALVSRVAQARLAGGTDPATGAAAPVSGSLVTKLQDPRIKPLLALFDHTGDDQSFVRLWRSLLDQTSRRISTEFGDFYVANL